MKRLQCIQLIIWAIKQQQQQQQKNGIVLHSCVQIVENMVGILNDLAITFGLSVCLSSGSQLGIVFLPRRYLTTSEDILKV